MTNRRMTTARLMGFVCLIALVFVGMRSYRDMTEGVVQGAWIGWSRDALRETLGGPHEIHNGDFYPSSKYRTLPGSVTLFYKTRRGILYLHMRPGAGGGVLL